LDPQVYAAVILQPDCGLPKIQPWWKCIRQLPSLLC